MAGAENVKTRGFINNKYILASAYSDLDDEAGEELYG